jgi:hypothetical protein
MMHERRQERSERQQRSDAGYNYLRSGQAPTHEQIAVRAYEIFLARGGEHGKPNDDWFQAERELTGHSHY